MAGLGEDIKVYGENYADNKAIAKNKTEYTDSMNLGEGGQNGSFNLKGVVRESITLAKTKVLTIKLQDSDDDESFDDKFAVKTVTADSDVYSVPAGSELFNIGLGIDAKPFTRFSITTDDATAAGKVDIYPQYLPR